MLYKKDNTRFKHIPANIHGASEVVGTILLVSIAVSLVALLAFTIFNISSAFFPSISPAVDIVGSIEGDDIVLLHHGGEALPYDTRVILSIGDNRITMFLGDLNITDDNGDGKWNLGEVAVYTDGTGMLQVAQVTVNMYSAADNSIILRTLLQEGLLAVNPVIETLPAQNIRSRQADIRLWYDFQQHTSGIRQVRFRHIRQEDYLSGDTNWTNTTWYNVPVTSGFYSVTLLNLNSSDGYLYQAQMRYSDTNGSYYDYLNGTIVGFTTLSSLRAQWHFNESTGLVAYDSSANNNHGSLLPANETIAPTHDPNGITNYSLGFDGLNDFVRVNHASSLNLVEQLTIEAWVKPVTETSSTGTGIASIHSQGYGPKDFACYTPDIARVTDNIYVIVTRGLNQKGFVTTINITDSGVIVKNATSYTVDQYEFESSRCYYPRIIKINGSTDKFAIAYRGPSDRGYLKTIQILDNGSIVKTNIDTETVDAAASYAFDFQNINNGIYALMYSAGGGLQGRLKTMNFDSNGFITFIDTWTFMEDLAPMVQARMANANIFHVADQNYSIVYQDNDLDASVKPVRIDTMGMIYTDNTLYRSEKFDDNTTGLTPFIVQHVHGNCYAVFYSGTHPTTFVIGAGLLRTIRLTNRGTLSNAGVSVELIEPSNAFRSPDFIHIAGSTFAVSYTTAEDTSGYGYLRTINIDVNGIITYESGNTSRFLNYHAPSQIGACYNPRITEVNQTTDMYALVFSTFSTTNFDSNNGLVKTVGIHDNGTITKQIIDYGLLGPSNSINPEIIHIGGWVYATYYIDQSLSYIVVSTVLITNAGLIAPFFIDNLIVNVPYGFNATFPSPTIKMISIDPSDNIYALVFSSDRVSMNISTLRIDLTGKIDDTLIDYYEIARKYSPTATDTYYYTSPDIIHIDGDVYAVSYHRCNRTSLQHEFLTTLQISFFGFITPVDSFSTNQYPLFANTLVESTQLLNIGTERYSLLISGEHAAVPSNYFGATRLFNLYIQDTGIIDGTILCTYSFHSHATQARIVNINDTIYALTYHARHGSALYGYLKTLNISTDGSSITSIDFGINMTNCQYPFLVFINNTVYALFYTDSSTLNGVVGVLRIAGNGQISRYKSSSQYFDAQLSLSTCVRPRVVHIDAYNYGFSYVGSLKDFYLQTVKFTFTSTQDLVRSILMKQSSYSLEATSTTVTATLRTSSGNKQLSLPLYADWNYLVITYDHTTITFYNIHSNITDKTTLACNQNVVTNSNPLYFGGFKGIYDEFTIYDECFTEPQIVLFYQQEILP